MFERLFAFIGGHPRGFDLVAAIAWTALTMSDDEFWSGGREVWIFVPLAFMTGVALYWRRRYPLHVFALQGLIVVVMMTIDIDDPLPGAVLAGTYSLAAFAPQRRLSVAYFVGFVLAVLATVTITAPSYLLDTLLIVLVLGVAWVIGDSLRTRRQYQDSVLDRAERAEALRDSLSLQAVAEERTRIARDLHDVVAHSMSLMVVQAGAARRVAATDPQASMAALEAIETVGRNSLGEMRRILGVLRGEDDANTLAPQPDIAAIDALVAEFRSAGLRITVSLAGTPRPLSPSVELTAYRIVQESLTNTLKHAGPNAATVIIDFDDDTLRIEVEDDGCGVSTFPATNTGSQKGHVGMRERVAAFGGSFAVGPRLDGGYLVAATLSLDGADRARSANQDPQSASTEAAS